VRQPLAITSANADTFTAGVASSFTVDTTGFPIAKFLRSGVLPTGLTFTDNLNGTATISGTTSSAGTYVLNLTAYNGISVNATQKFTLTVS
jgi:hypothetical protein